MNVFEAPPSMSHGAVRDALVANRADRLQQQFSCDGRACGSSGDWSKRCLWLSDIVWTGAVSALLGWARRWQSTGNQFMWVEG